MGDISLSVSDTQSLANTQWVGLLVPETNKNKPKSEDNNTLTEMGHSREIS